MYGTEWSWQTNIFPHFQAHLHLQFGFALNLLTSLSRISTGKVSQVMFDAGNIQPVVLEKHKHLCGLFFLWNFAWRNTVFCEILPKETMFFSVKFCLNKQNHLFFLLLFNLFPWLSPIFMHCLHSKAASYSCMDLLIEVLDAVSTTVNSKNKAFVDTSNSGCSVHVSSKRKLPWQNSKVTLKKKEHHRSWW